MKRASEVKQIESSNWGGNLFGDQWRQKKASNKSPNLGFACRPCEGLQFRLTDLDKDEVPKIRKLKRQNKKIS